MVLPRARPALAVVDMVSPAARCSYQVAGIGIIGRRSKRIPRGKLSGSRPAFHIKSPAVVWNTPISSARESYRGVRGGR